MNTPHFTAPSSNPALHPAQPANHLLAPASQGNAGPLPGSLDPLGGPDAQRQVWGRSEAPVLEVCWARHEDEVRQAQRLRYQIFAEEMGAKLSCPPGTPAGLDVDAFDAHCEHLLVRTRESAHAPAEVVGTYRVLTPAAARRAGGLYSDQEFDLSRLDTLRPQVVELGRSCTAPAWRSGGVILMLWGALADFMLRNGLKATLGCASVPMQDGGHGAASLWQQLSQSRLHPEGVMATPRLPLPLEHLRSDLAVTAPPLIKGYLKCGGKVLGPPAWDPDFGMADLPIMLTLADLPEAYRRRFSRAA